METKNKTGNLTTEMLYLKLSFGRAASGEWCGAGSGGRCQILLLILIREAEKFSLLVSG